MAFEEFDTWLWNNEQEGIEKKAGPPLADVYPAPLKDEVARLTLLVRKSEGVYSFDYSVSAEVSEHQAGWALGHVVPRVKGAVLSLLNKSSE